MSINIRNQSILKAAGAAVFATVLCVGCYDLGIEPSVKPPVITTFVDVRDGHVYKKEQIGDQIWMAENLNYAADGSVCYDNNDNNCKVYGRLYDWYTAMGDESSSSGDPSGVEGVCPVGWHLPSDAEWQKLIDYVGLHSGTKLKSKTFPTDNGQPIGTDIYNFSALPSGAGSHHDNSYYFIHVRDVGYWWSATEMDSDADRAWCRQVQNTSETVVHYYLDKHSYFLSVRCVHD